MKKSLVSKLSYFCVTASLASFLVLSGCGTTDNNNNSVPQKSVSFATYTLSPGKAGSANEDYVAATINATVVNTNAGAGEKIQILFANNSSTSTDNYQVQVQILAADLQGYSGKITYNIYAKSSNTSETSSGNVTANGQNTLTITTGLVTTNSKIELQLPVSGMNFKLRLKSLAPTTNAMPTGSAKTAVDAYTDTIIQISGK